MTTLPTAHRPGGWEPERLERACAMSDMLSTIDISECNGNFQSMVLDRLDASGKPLTEFTIGEFRALVDKVSEEWDQICRRLSDAEEHF